MKKLIATLFAALLSTAALADDISNDVITNPTIHNGVGFGPVMERGDGEFRALEWDTQS